MGGKLTTLHDQNILKPKSALSVENIDLKKLRRLILTRRLAPFWDPSDLEQAGREECPICNYWYPSMNSASCCTARLCTECFVSCQTSSEPPGKATCPFCKHSPFCVRYSGSKSLQQIEEEGRQKQIVAEAKLRRLRSFDSSAAQRLQQQPAASTATADSSDHQQRQQFNPAAARRQGAGALQGSNRVSYGNTADEVTSTNEARILRHQQRHQRSDAVPAVMFAQQQAEQLQHPPLPTSTLLPQNLVEQDSQQRDVQPVIDQHMHQQQQRPEQQQQQQQLPDEAEEQTEPTIPNLWFEAALLPLYVRNELAGLQLEELEQIMVEQALIASMQQAASSSAVEQTAHSQLGSSQFPAAATCQGSSQLTQTLGTAAAAAAAAIHGVLPVVQQRQQQHPAEHYDWQSCMTVYQFAAVVTAYSSSGGQEAVVPLYMVSGGSSSRSEGSDACLQHRQPQKQQEVRQNVEQQAQTTQAGMLARDDREEQKQEGSHLTADATPATAGQGAESTIGCHEEPVATAGGEFEADVQGYVLSAPALLSALEGCSAAAAAGGGGGGEEAFMHTFISLSNEQQQQAAAAAMATSLAVVQNPDGSVLLLTDIPGRITPAAAAAVAAAAVVPISELCDESDTGLQRHLAAADARFAVAAAARNSSRQDSPHSATVAADQAGAAAPSGVAVHDTLLQQRLAAEDVQYASRLAAACSRSQQLVSTHGGAATADADPIAGGSCTAVASSQVPSQQPSANASSSHAHGTALPVEGAITAMSGVPVHQATPVAGAAAAMQPLRSQADLPDDSDFAERLRERDEAYAAALMARLVQKE